MDPLGLEYRRIDPDDPAVAGLIARHAAHGDAHYPAESNHHQDGASMAAEGVTLFAGLRDGVAVAMGGYKVIAPGDGEVKSMHVTEAARGQGAGARILEMILDHARERGLDRLFLETGSREASAAARRLYERAGFSYCAPFGAYVDDPMSVFMTRAL
jgi:putative acetyltransferase